jgi:hypothetical protein
LGTLQGRFRKEQSLGNQEAQQIASGRVVQAIPQGFDMGQGRWIQPEGDGLER